jgi:uncharacterized protein (DUF2225 family)
MNRKEFKKHKSKALTIERYKGSVIDVDMDSKVRCPHCNYMFFKGTFKGAIQIKCPMKDCKEMVNIQML